MRYEYEREEKGDRTVGGGVPGRETRAEICFSVSVACGGGAFGAVHRRAGEQGYGGTFQGARHAGKNGGIIAGRTGKVYLLVRVLS